MIKINREIFHLDIYNNLEQREDNSYLRFYFTLAKEEKCNINDLFSELYEEAMAKYSKDQLSDVHLVKQIMLKSGYFKEIPDKEAISREFKQFILNSDRTWFCIYSGKVKPVSK